MRWIRQRRLTNDDKAVAGIVVAVMMVGLILAVVSLVQVYYVPKWMKAREAEHLGNVEDQFSQLKSVIDQQAAEGSAGGNGQHIPISTSVTLGSENLGFLMSQRAFGHINLIDQGSSVLVTMESLASEQYDMTILKYMSENAYYLNQGYVVEAGALILNQSGSSVFVIKPSIWTDYSNHVLVFNWTCIDLDATGGVSSLSGYGTYPIQTKYVGNGTANIDDVSSISIITYHPNIWRKLFVDLITSTPTGIVGTSFANVTDFTIQPFTPGENGRTEMTISFNCGAGKLLEDVVFNINLVTIAVQFAPGWID
jgi:hypothetical protein